MNPKFYHKLILVLLVVLSNQSMVVAEPKPAIEVIKEAATNVVDRIRSEKSTLEQDPDAVHELVNELIIPHFDFVSMSKWVLGKKHWTSSSVEQREEFIQQFKILLVNTYAKALLQYSDQTINYLSEKPTKKATLVEVLTEVEQDGADAIPINYRMHISDGSWKVVDVVVNGASLVRTYRGEFTSHIRKHGLPDLIAKLKQRNQA